MRQNVALCGSGLTKKFKEKKKITYDIFSFNVYVLILALLRRGMHLYRGSSRGPYLGDNYIVRRRPFLTSICN